MEEIFGPILPVIGIKSAAEVIEYIQSHERPLAMYWFGKNKKVLNEVYSFTKLIDELHPIILYWTSDYVYVNRKLLNIYTSKYDCYLS